MKLRVTPNAKQYRVEVRDGKIVVRLPAKPVEGEANKALVKALEKATGTKVTLVSGAKTRDKVVVFEGLDEEEALKLILTPCRSQ